MPLWSIRVAPSQPQSNLNMTSASVPPQYMPQQQQSLADSSTVVAPNTSMANPFAPPEEVKQSPIDAN